MPGPPGDAGPGDAGPGDAGPDDAGPEDAGPEDAGSTDGGPDDAGSADAGPALALVVAPQFPVTGEGWNDYVQNDAATPADASGAPCGTLVDYPSAAARGMWTVDVGRIWDWRLRAADTVLRGTTGDGATQTEPFIAGADCPASAHGDRATTSLRTPPDTYLLSAIESVEDLAGDNDGLCESNERCVFAPSFGAYQGEGALIGPCVFADGAVAGVTLFAHPTPGSP